MMRQGRWWRHTSVILGAVLAFMSLAAWSSQPWWEYAFISDDSAVSWLSSALLMANAAVAVNLAVTGALNVPLAVMLALALAVMSADEQFLLHERFKALAPPWMGDGPTVLVGVGGVAVLIVLAATTRSRAARSLFAIAVTIGIFALWIDLGAPPPRLARLEEAFEVLAEAVFLSGLLEVSRIHVQSAS